MNPKRLKPEDEIASLKSEVKILRSENEALHQKIRDLENALIDGMEPGSHALLLEKLKVDILLFLFNQKETVTADEIARYLQINSQIILHHLTELSQKALVLRSSRVNAPPFWRLGDEGRAYLINNNLIS